VGKFLIKLKKFSIGLKKSWPGFVAGGIYITAGIIALCWHLYSVSTNVADSGLSALYLYFLSKPWIDWVPNAFVYSGVWGWIVYPVALLFVSFNGFLLYILFGGMKISKHKPGA